MSHTPLKQKQANWGQTIATETDFILNKPTIVIADGSETKLVAGTNTTLTGAGTIASPYQISAVVPAAVVSTAINGTSKSGADIVLGNNMGGVVAALISNREIPTAGFSLNLSGNAKFGIGRSSNQPAQTSLHIGNGNTTGVVGNNSFILTTDIGTTQNVGANVIVNGQTSIVCASDNSAILSGLNVSVTEAANNNSDLTTVGGASSVNILNARGATVLGSHSSPANTPFVASTISNKYFSGLYSTTNGWIQGTAIASSNNGDNNAIIGGNNNLIGGNLVITGVGGSYNIVPALLGTAALNYVDDSVIIGSQFSQITDTGNAVIISGERGLIRGAVRSAMVASDNSNMVATTRNVSGGQMFMASSNLGALTNVSYSALIGTDSSVMDGTTGGAKNRSVAIAGIGLLAGASDQLVQGTYNEGLSTSSVEFGIGVLGARKNALAVSKTGATILAKLPTSNNPVGTAGGMYFNTTENEFKTCKDGTNWVTVGSGVQRIAFIQSFNALVTGLTAFYTVPAGKFLVITNIVFRTDIVVATTAAPTISVGSDVPSYGNIMLSTPLTGAFTGGKAYVYNVFGSTNVLPPATVLNLQVDTAGAGTTLTYGADLFGYLL
jgi:hypothetical protein